MQRIRKLRSVLNPFRNPGGDQSCPKSELAAELTAAIGQIQSAAGLLRCFDLIREVRLPATIGKVALAALRTTFDGVVAGSPDGGGAGDGAAPTEDADRLRRALEAREHQLVAHGDLGALATNPLQLLTPPANCADRAVRLPAVAASSASGATDLDVLLQCWSRTIPDGSSCAAVPVEMAVGGFFWIIDQVGPDLFYILKPRAPAHALALRQLFVWSLP
jgi:hypothetical protein